MIPVPARSPIAFGSVLHSLYTGSSTFQYLLFAIVSPYTVLTLEFPTPLSMVRTRPTGPASAVQLQPVKVIQPIVAESKIAPQTKAQTQVDAPPTLTTTRESLALQQQQSLEMVQIMLHVSVSVTWSFEPW